MGKRVFEEDGRVGDQKNLNESIRPPPRRVYNFGSAHFDGFDKLTAGKLSANRTGQAQDRYLRHKYPRHKLAGFFNFNGWLWGC